MWILSTGSNNEYKLMTCEQTEIYGAGGYACTNVYWKYWRIFIYLAAKITITVFSKYKHLNWSTSNNILLAIFHSKKLPKDWKIINKVYGL